MKNTKYPIILVTGTLVLISIVVQINFERYIVQQNKHYDLLKDKRRVSYMPVVIYLVKNTFVKNPLDGEVSNCIYKHAASTNVIISEGSKDEYMVNCYFKEAEKEWELEHCKIEVDTTKKDSIPDKIIYIIP
ncbi:MAG TPA: hypothetical protein VNB90_09420 [Cytophagaceae bacterium]|jgi:hypothetical protein|nr:hypothetical protein [Cytophagaceae bacterium]